MAKATTDLAKQLKAATDELTKEQHDWGIKKGALQREHLHLEAQIKDFEKRIPEKQLQLEDIKSEVDVQGLRHERLIQKNTDLERENSNLEDKLEKTKVDLQRIVAELDAKKASIDQELAEYSAASKLKIKDEILSVNDNLTKVQEQLTTVTGELEAKRTELTSLNELYRDEQHELIESNKETKQLIADNENTIAESKKRLETLQTNLKQTLYELQQATTALTKSREEHTKYVEYEKQARKTLDAKDRQLQEKSAEINEKSQFLQNSRSFLPPL